MCSGFFPDAPYQVDDDPQRRSWSVEISPGVWEMDIPRQLLTSFFNEEIFSSFDSRNVFVMGFSQGAIYCYEFILKMEAPLGGVFPIAGFLRHPDSNGSIFPSRPN